MFGDLRHVGHGPEIRLSLRRTLPGRDADLTPRTVQSAEPFFGPRRPSARSGARSPRAEPRARPARPPPRPRAPTAAPGSRSPPRSGEPLDRGRRSPRAAARAPPRPGLSFFSSRSAAGVAELRRAARRAATRPARANDCTDAVELPLEPSRRVLLRSLDRPFELDGRRIDEPRRPRDRATRSSCSTCRRSTSSERRLDPPRRVRLLALDPAEEVAFARPSCDRRPDAARAGDRPHGSRARPRRSRPRPRPCARDPPEAARRRRFCSSSAVFRRSTSVSKRASSASISERSRWATCSRRVPSCPCARSRS